MVDFGRKVPSRHLRIFIPRLLAGTTWALSFQGSADIARTLSLEIIPHGWIY